MGRLKSSAALLGLAGLTVSACAPMHQDGALGPGAYNPSLYAVNQPIVQRTDYVLDLEAGGGSIPPSELDRLSAWFQSLRLGYGDRVFVDDGAYGDPRIRQDVASVAGAYGLLLSDGSPVTAGQVRAGAARVIVSRSSATVPGCPVWEDPKVGGINTTSTNYGCSVNSNLASMIADPNDLVLGQDGSADADGATASKAIKLYREAKPTGAGGLKQTVTKGGQ